MAESLSYAEFKLKLPAGSKKFVPQEPYIDNSGIWVPECPYVEEGTASHYKMIISKELFVEAYNKWIKGVTAE